VTADTDQFVGEIRVFGFSFAPTGWALCDGQLLPISQNTALFSILGTYYGGDGVSYFALPDLQGLVPMHQGTGAGLTERFLGESAGTETVTLLQSEIPSHSHTMSASSQAGTDQSPSGELPARAVGGIKPYADVSAGSATTMGTSTLAPAGSGAAHNNLQPYLTLSYCIALQGIFPPRD
jgi:microcystin-dependent protein